MERFRDGREAVKDDEGRERPTSSKNVEMLILLEAWLKKMEDCQFVR